MWWYVEVGAFGSWLSREGGALVDEISALVKETPESPFTRFSHVRTQQKLAVSDQEVGPGPYQIPSLPETWPWTSQPCEKAMSVVFKPASSLQQPEQAKTAHLPSILRISFKDRINHMFVGRWEIFIRQWKTDDGGKGGAIKWSPVLDGRMGSSDKWRSWLR